VNPTLRRLLREARPYYPRLVAGSLLGVLAGVAPLTLAKVAGYLQSDVLVRSPHWDVLALVIGLGVAAHDLAPAIGAVVVFVPFAAAALATRGRGMGWGDVKLAALGGALLGVAGATLAFLVAALTAYAIARTTGGLRRTIAFGPYLAASIAATLVIVRIP